MLLRHSHVMLPWFRDLYYFSCVRQVPFTNGHNGGIKVFVMDFQCVGRANEGCFLSVLSPPPLESLEFHEVCFG